MTYLISEMPNPCNIFQKWCLFMGLPPMLREEINFRTTTASLFLSHLFTVICGVGCSNKIQGFPRVLMSNWHLPWYYCITVSWNSFRERSTLVSFFVFSSSWTHGDLIQRFHFCLYGFIEVDN
jgi:hypothetical protein